jgi:hypothetical protein
MNELQTERAGIERAEDSTPTPKVSVAPLFGPGGWREQHRDMYGSDAALRWVIQDKDNRQRLRDARAMGLIGAKLVAFEPAFTRVLIEIACEELVRRDDMRATSFAVGAQAVADRATTN